MNYIVQYESKITIMAGVVVGIFLVIAGFVVVMGGSDTPALILRAIKLFMREG